MARDILIVDDSACVRKMIRHAFEKEAGCTICGEAENGVEGIEQAENLHPDLVVVDFSMRALNGLEVAKALRRSRPDMPIVLFTLFKDANLEREAFAAGVSFVVSKEEGLEGLTDSARFLLKYSTPEVESAPPATIPGNSQ